MEHRGIISLLKQIQAIIKANSKETLVGYLMHHEKKILSSS
jgi:hypothetical protein